MTLTGRAAVARSAADALARLGDLGRRLEPHQVAPPGDWRGWALIGGRGSGKTQACSQYVVDHVNGPPCLPGPVPHWIGIIAPTLGDAATSCFYGPSGIRSLDPAANVMGSDEVIRRIEAYVGDARNFPVGKLLDRRATRDATTRLTGGAGGLSVRWPNGSEAKLFGASSPEDVERLRAGGNRCLASGTQVRVVGGLKAIENVRVGDRVWTRNGPRRVLRAGQTGVRRLWKIETAYGRTLLLTGDHEVWTRRGWVEARFLTPNDTLDVWQDASSTTAFVGTNDVMATSPTRGEDEDCFIDTCGNERTVRSPGIRSSIISSRTISIPPTSYDLNCSHTPSTRIGTQVATCRRQTHARGGQPGVIDRTWRARVSSAATRLRVDRSTCPRYVVDHDVVNCRLSPRAGRHARVPSGCVQCAVTSSPPSISQPPKLAHDSVARIEQLSRVEPVYDIMVEHDHEFFADGILVANCLVWAEELAAWRHLDDTWDQMRFGLRTGPRPHWIGSTTPKPRVLVRKMMLGGMPGVVTTHATMWDNPHLPHDVRQELEDTYGGRTIGRQELYAELIEQDENALWQRAWIQNNRLPATVNPRWTKITVGVDPSGGAGEQGVVVDASWVRNEVVDGKRLRMIDGYVLDDRTCRKSPDGWGRQAVVAAVDWEADQIVVETNYGGEMAISVIRGAADALGVNIPIRAVTASRGKKVRAEPVAALSERGRWHHVGVFPELEDQLCTWTEESDYSPDRLDAMVWPAWKMRLVGPTTLVGSTGAYPGGAMTRTRLG